MLKITVSAIACLEGLGRPSSTWFASGQVAEVLFLDEKTVRSYFARYSEVGEKGLVQLHYQGKSPSLSDDQQEEPARHLDETTRLHSSEIRRHVLKTYGVDY